MDTTKKRKAEKPDETWEEQVARDLKILSEDELCKKYNPNYDILKAQDGILEPPPKSRAAKSRRKWTAYGEPTEPSLKSDPKNWGRRFPRFENNAFHSVNDMLNPKSKRRPRKRRETVDDGEAGPAERPKKKQRLVEIAKATDGGWTPPESDAGAPTPGEQALESIEQPEQKQRSTKKRVKPARDHAQQVTSQHTTHTDQEADDREDEPAAMGRLAGKGAKVTRKAAPPVFTAQSDRSRSATPFEYPED